MGCYRTKESVNDYALWISEMITHVSSAEKEYRLTMSEVILLLSVAALGNLLVLGDLSGLLGRGPVSCRSSMPSLVHEDGDGKPEFPGEPFCGERPRPPMSLSAKEVMIGARTMAGTPGVRTAREWACRYALRVQPTHLSLPGSVYDFPLVACRGIDGGNRSVSRRI